MCCLIGRSWYHCLVLSNRQIIRIQKDTMIQLFRHIILHKRMIYLSELSGGQSCTWSMKNIEHKKNCEAPQRLHARQRVVCAPLPDVVHSLGLASVIRAFRQLVTCLKNWLHSFTFTEELMRTISVCPWSIILSHSMNIEPDAKSICNRAFRRIRIQKS